MVLVDAGQCTAALRQFFVQDNIKPFRLTAQLITVQVKSSGFLLSFRPYTDGTVCSEMIKRSARTMVLPKTTQDTS